LMALVPSSVSAQAIEGAAERFRFEPGDRLIYQSDLSSCPVGEFLPGWKILRGAYECARFQDRIWIRPLEQGTVLYLRFKKPLPEEFSLEFPVWVAEEGCPYVEFRLISEEFLARIEDDPGGHVNHALIGGHLACFGEQTAFGSRNQPGYLQFDLKTKLSQGKIHRIAVQVRRGQVRFFVDGKRIAHRPFRPTSPIGGLTLYFYKVFETPTPYADAPALVGEIRLAEYTTPELAPGAEQDLINELGGEVTEEGVRVTLAEAVLFDFGRWELKPEARETLKKLAALAKLYRGRVRVEGHTDNVGSAEFNLVLSELRAHVVALELARLGVDPNRIVARGYGESRPVAPNDSEANRAKNRRVEVILERAS